MTLDRKISTLDRAWEEVQRSYVAVSLLNSDGQGGLRDDDAADLGVYEQVKDSADDVIALNQPQQPAVPTLADEILLLESTKEREETLMEAMITAIEAKLMEPDLTMAILTLQLNLLQKQ